MTFFGEDFFSHGIGNFTECLSLYKDVEAHFLEIGSYEGRSSFWILQNILTHPKSTLTCIEPGYCTDNSVEMLRTNLAEFGNKVTILPYESISGLSKLLFDNTVEIDKQYIQPYNEDNNRCIKPCFDFIYVDGIHVGCIPLQDIIMSYPLLKIGGIMALDDFVWGFPLNDPPVLGTVNICFNHFISLNISKIKILKTNLQMWFQKIA